MSARRGGLGRGLGALLPTGPVSAAVTAPDPAQSTDSAQPTPPTQPTQPTQPAHPNPPSQEAARYRELPVGAISANPQQPRTVFDEQALAELVASVREVGVLQPVIVREVTSGRYEMVMGERRLRAAREAGLATVPAVIRDTADDALLRDALLENVHREDLNPLEEAAAYEALLRELDATHDQLAAMVGKSRSAVSNTIRLLQLPAPVQRRVAAGVLSAGHARALLSVESPDEQEVLAGRIVAEGLSVRATEELAIMAAAPAPVPRTARAPHAQPPVLAELAGRLADRLDTRVKIDLGRRKGRIVVEFASVDDLERIAAILTPAGELIPTHS